MIHAEINNIILDLGGVILEIDVDRTIFAFRDLGFPEIENADIILSKYPFFLEFEVGNLSPLQFRDEIRKVTGNNLSDRVIDNAWNAMIIGFPENLITTLQWLKKRYRLFLLSNTNAIHEVTYNNLLNEVYGIGNLSALFNKVYYSHRLHLRKPNPEIFDFVIKDSGLEPGETLFIDDMPVNLESAAKLGIRTHHLKAPQRLSDLIYE